MKIAYICVMYFVSWLGGTSTSSSQILLYCMWQSGVNVLFIRKSDVTNSKHKLRQFSNSLTFYFRILDHYYISFIILSSIIAFTIVSSDRKISFPSFWKILLPKCKKCLPMLKGRFKSKKNKMDIGRKYSKLFIIVPKLLIFFRETYNLCSSICYFLLYFCSCFLMNLQNGSISNTFLVLSRIKTIRLRTNLTNW